MALWLSKRLVLAVKELLPAPESGPIGACNPGKLSRGLLARGVSIAELGEDDGAGDGAAEARYSAIVVEDITRRADWALRVPRLLELLQPGARLIALDRSAAQLCTRRLLCGGFTDIHQREFGRRVLTTGRRP